MQMLCIVCGQAVPDLTSEGKPRKDMRFCRLQCRQIWVNTPGTMEQRFWSYVNKNGMIHPEHGQCWEWTAATYWDGYGAFSIGHAKTGRAHCYSWTLHFGDRGDNLVLHKCDNPICVNPSHLMLGSHQDNVADKCAKGRQGIGSRNSMAVLTEEQVREIKRRYIPRCAVNGAGPLGREFGCSLSAIDAIGRGKTWKHIQ